MASKQPVVNHLLQKQGVLIAFHICKNVKPKEVSKLYKNLKNKKKYSKEDRESMAEQLLATVTTTLSDVPGILNAPKEKVIEPNQYTHSISELMDASNVITDILMDSDYSPKECRFIINNAIISLNLDDPELFDEGEFDDEEMGEEGEEPLF